MNIGRLTVVLLAGLCSPGAAMAGEGCKCRANGADFEQGMIICIRGELARCSMNQNVPSWVRMSDQCPQTLLMTPKPLRLAAAPLRSLARR